MHFKLINMNNKQNTIKQSEFNTYNQVNKINNDFQLGIGEPQLVY